MKTIGLKTYIIMLMVVVSMLSLLLTSGFILYQSNNKYQEQINKTVSSTARQLNVQLIKISTNFQRAESFPDLMIWEEAGKYSGMCIQFLAINPSHERYICKGYLSETSSPKLFDRIYSLFFDPSNIITRDIEHAGNYYGTLEVKFSEEYVLQESWGMLKKLIGLSSVTMFSLMLMLFIAIGYAIKPSKNIIERLEKMTKNDFDCRLPNFFIAEWHRTGSAINHLSDELQSTLKERRSLSIKLVKVQEEERKFIARELHDEFGQSLAGLSAVGELIVQLSSEKCQKLVAQGEKVNRITSHMMSLLQKILSHLRPTDFDELGLVPSLNNMISSWNNQFDNGTSYKLDIQGCFSDIPDTVALNIFRIVQECLTNIAKHSYASDALIRLERLNNYHNKSSNLIKIHIEDNGTASKDDFLSKSSGRGILGIYERVKIFDGKVIFHTLQNNGLVIDIEIPFIQHHGAE